MIDRLELSDELLGTIKDFASDNAKTYGVKNRLDFSMGGNPVLTFQDEAGSNVGKLYVTKEMMDQISAEAEEKEITTDYKARHISLALPVGIVVSMVVASVILIQLLSR